MLLSIALLLPATVGTALGVGYIYDEQQEAYRRAIQDTSHAMSLVLDREFARRETLLRSLAASPDLERGDLEAFHKHATKVASDLKESILLHDAAGNVMLHTRFPFGTVGLPPANSLVQMRQRSGTDEPLVSNVFLAPTAKAYAFAVQVPVTQNGDRAYLALASVTTQLFPLFGEHRLPQGWFGSIIDRSGVLAARTQDQEKFVGALVPEEQRQFMREKRQGFLDFTTLAGVPITGFISQAPKSGWTFVIGVPRVQLRASAIRATAIMGGIAALLLGLALATAYFVGKRIARPIEELGLAATKLRDGVPLARQRSRIAEIDAVNTEMVSASAEIRSTKADLESRIAEAVASSERSQRALLQSQKMEALGRLTGGIAHDFNNVLQTLTTGLQLAHFSSTDPRLQKLLKTCELAVDRAADLVRQLMAFGRVQDAHMKSVCLPDKMREIAPMLKGGLRGNIAFELDIADDIWPVKIDTLQFELALLNLCINARDAMPNGGTVKLSVRNRSLKEPLEGLAPGEYVQISISDSGVGMTPEVQRQALEPFFTTKGVGRGSGLGLPQAYGCATQAGGTLTIESETGKGTTVILYIPRTLTPVAIQKEDGNDATLPSLKGRVLLVDDESLVLEVVTPALEAAGLEVQQASSGDEALTLLQAGATFDLVLSDIVMPGRISGIDLAEIVKARFPGTRIVLATGYSERSAAIPGVRILAKPYGVADAINALRSELAVSTGRLAM